MATKYANGTSMNWTDSTWGDAAVGPFDKAPPSSGDDADLNSTAVTVDADVNIGVGKILGAGSLVLGAGASRSVTADCSDSATATWTCAMASGKSLTIVGAIGAKTNTRITMTGGTLVYGTIADAPTAAKPVINMASGSPVVSGGAIGAISGNNSGAIWQYVGTLTITGDIAAPTATSGTQGLYTQGGTTSITGNIAGGAGASCAGMSVAGATVTQTGNVTGSSTGTGGTAAAMSSGTYTLNGTAKGGSKDVGVSITGGTFNLNGMLDETGLWSAFTKKGGGTFNWTPSPSSTYTRGGFAWHNPDRYTDPGAANVATGSNYTYNAVAKTASYPTTATTHAADAATLEAEKAYLLATKTITFGASSVAGTLPVARVMAANGGNILTTDVRSDTATGAAAGGTIDLTNMVAGNIKNGVIVGGVTGTNVGTGFNTDPGVANVRNGQAYTILNVAKSGTLDVAEDNTTDGGGIGIGI